MRIVVVAAAVGGAIGVALWGNLWTALQVCVLFLVGYSVILWFALALWERKSK